MKIYCFHLISQVVVSKNNTHDASHLTVFNRFRKNVENAYLRISEDFS